MGVTAISKYINSNFAILQDSVYPLVPIGSHSNKECYGEIWGLQVLMSSQTLCPLILSMSSYSPFPIWISGHSLLGEEPKEFSQYILPMVLKGPYS